MKGWPEMLKVREVEVSCMEQEMDDRESDGENGKDREVGIGCRQAGMGGTQVGVTGIGGWQGQKG